MLLELPIEPTGRSPPSSLSSTYTKAFKCSRSMNLPVDWTAMRLRAMAAGPLSAPKLFLGVYKLAQLYPAASGSLLKRQSSVVVKLSLMSVFSQEALSGHAPAFGMCSFNLEGGTRRPESS